MVHPGINGLTLDHGYKYLLAIILELCPCICFNSAYASNGLENLKMWPLVPCGGSVLKLAVYIVGKHFQWWTKYLFSFL